MAADVVVGESTEHTVFMTASECQERGELRKNKL